jgi:tetratricopeptide (TPR) repeat protein
MRHLLAVYLAVLIVGTLAAADTEGDIAICADEKSPDAMAACTRLIEAAQLPPDKLAEVYDNRASLRLSSGDADRALADYDAAIRLAPAEGEIRMDRGDAFRATGDEVKALADYEEAVRLKPDLWRAHYMRAYSLEGRGDHAAAIEGYTRAAKLAPDNPDPHCEIGVIYFNAGDHARQSPNTARRSRSRRRRPDFMIIEDKPMRRRISWSARWPTIPTRFDSIPKTPRSSRGVLACSTSAGSGAERSPTPARR